MTHPWWKPHYYCTTTNQKHGECSICGQHEASPLHILSPQAAGAPGLHPKGKLDESDDGQLNMAIVTDPDAGLIRLVYGKPVAWMALGPDEAIGLARILLERAAEIKAIESEH